MTKRAREYKAQVREVLRDHILPDGQVYFPDGALRTIWMVHPPDRRKRDLSNLLKALEDSLTGIVWSDDYQIRDIRMVSRPIKKQGGVVLLCCRSESTLRSVGDTALL